METEAAGWGHTQQDAALRLSVTATLVGGAEAAGRRGPPGATGAAEERSSFDEDYITGQDSISVGPAAAGLKPTLCEGHRGHIVAVDA